MSSSVERGELTLEEVKNQRSTTPPEERRRCPSCLGVSVEKKQPAGQNQPNRQPGRFRCHNCNNHFDTPVTGVDPTIDD